MKDFCFTFGDTLYICARAKNEEERAGGHSLCPYLLVIDIEKVEIRDGKLRLEGKRKEEKDADRKHPNRLLSTRLF